MPGLDEVVAMDSGRYGNPVSEGLHELEHRRLAENVLKYDPVRPDPYVCLARYDLLVGGIVQVR